jgi:hypothetical protein
MSAAHRKATFDASMDSAVQGVTRRLSRIIGSGPVAAVVNLTI